MDEAEPLDLQEFQDAVMTALPALRDEIVRILDALSQDEPARDTLRRLVSYQLSRAQAALYLTSSGMPWDGEIVLRSFYEASARILMIALATKPERERLVAEYWDTLGAIADRKRALKIDGKLPAHDPRAAAVMDVFRDPALFAVEPRVSKAERQAIEQRWSFTEIIRALSKLDHPEVRELRHLRGYLHSYGMESHLLHVDATALDLMHDRATRPAEERALLVASHVSRIFMDVVGLEFMTALALRAMGGMEFEDRAELARKVLHCQELASPLKGAFYDSQAEFYRSHGRSEFDSVTPSGG